MTTENFSHPGWDRYYDPDPGGFDRDAPVYFNPAAWDDELAAIQERLEGREVPRPIRADLEVAVAQRGNPTYRPYFDRVITWVNSQS